MRRLLSRLLPARVVRDRIYYAPSADGLPEPGEVCWAWVPYEEDASQGKDRPVLVVGMRGKQWLALMHDRQGGVMAGVDYLGGRVQQSLTGQLSQPEEDEEATDVQSFGAAPAPPIDAGGGVRVLRQGQGYAP